MLNRSTTRNLRRLMPQKEAITFRSRNISQPAATTFTDYLIPQAKQFAVTVAHEGPDSTTPVLRCDWLLWAELLEAAGAPDPKGGDRIVQADGTTWVVKEKNNGMFGNDYRLSCVQKVGT